MLEHDIKLSRILVTEITSFPDKKNVAMTYANLILMGSNTDHGDLWDLSTYKMVL